ncbi:UDP-glycosyltransferase UGT5-like [Episyrphus balteatus]|uniref:UDP-glycosyltransferase UGT5-like n=1 Tax=Episyrphus balteatus TaxID=286459 RepID=UPI0024856485|nr:UDP-glycosyltransferase UGT5-like [Episyrphus balteatus]
MKFYKFLLTGILLIQSMAYVISSNILGMFLTHSPSHVIVHMGVVRALVEQGHNVTVITSMKLNDPNFGYRHIYLKTLEHTQKDTFTMLDKINRAPFYLKPFKWFELGKEMIDKFNSYNMDPDYIKFKNENNTFDLMLLGYQYNEGNLGEAAHFKCPTVLIWMMQPFGHISRLIGNPNLPAVIPFSPFITPNGMGFSDRVWNFIIYIFEGIATKTAEYFMANIYDQMYPSYKYPSYKEMVKNISLILYNHHFSEAPVRPQVPALIEIGGIQIKDKPDPLPKDIQEFLDNSPQGVIYFSLGSNACGLHVKDVTYKIIFEVLSSLKYNVIWKLDEISHPGNSSNILFKTWLPQDDILPHKNVKLFITHAGKGGVSESEYHQVPMIALPIMDDQHGNARVMAAKGHGIALDHETMTKEMFQNAINDVMENKKYRNAVEKFSKLYKDRPLTAQQTAVYWIEYVIRHKGAPHMQSPLKDLNVLQEHSIDVILFLVLVLYLTWKLGIILIKLVYKLVRSFLFRRQTKPSNKND